MNGLVVLSIMNELIIFSQENRIHEKSTVVHSYCTEIYAAPITSLGITGCRPCSAKKMDDDPIMDFLGDYSIMATQRLDIIQVYMAFL